MNEKVLNKLICLNTLEESIVTVVSRFSLDKKLQIQKSCELRVFKFF
jgi:hypothetical protein